MASFWLKILFVFSNTPSIFKVMLRNSNLTKLDMLTLSSSNITAPILKTKEHLKKTNKPCFYLHFANSNLKVNFSHFILNIKKKLFHIWNLHKIYVFNNIFRKSWLSQKWKKNPIFLKKINFYQPNLTVEFFLVFHPQDPKPNRIRQIASNRAKTRSTQSQTCVKYRGIIIFT